MELNKTLPVVLDTQEQTFACINLKKLQTINQKIISKPIMGFLRPHVNVYTAVKNLDNSTLKH